MHIGIDRDVGLGDVGFKIDGLLTKAVVAGKYKFATTDPNVQGVTVS